MADFFKPEDFDDIPINDTWDTSIVADRANQKLNRDAKVLYTKNNYNYEFHCQLTDQGYTHKALLINIEPIEVCKHEASKVRLQRNGKNIVTDQSGEFVSCDFEFVYKCKCGAPVKPDSFKEFYKNE